MLHTDGSPEQRTELQRVVEEAHNVPEPILEVTFDDGVVDTGADGLSLQAVRTRPAEAKDN